MIQPAPKRGRFITKQIRTHLFSGTAHGWVKAEYTDTREYTAVSDGPVFAFWTPSGIFQKGTWNGTWLGKVVVQGWGRTELDALQDLLLQLAELQLPVEDDPGAVLAELRATTTSTPWELRPFGIRPRKPQRSALRRKWTDTTTGKKHHIYTDTLRKHADPNCTCPFCFTPEIDPKDAEDDPTT